MRIFISADMEGVAGVVTPEQVGPGGFEYERFREIMTGEVLAAIQAAREADATAFVVADSHGNGQNLLVEHLPEDVEVVRSWPRPLHMMEGIDDSFDAAFLLGYHTSATNPEGVLAHTFSSAHLTAVRLAGRPASEAVVNAAIAGHFGVPVVMVSGDDRAVEEIRGQIGPVEGAVVKHALGVRSARTRTPAAAQREIREAVRRAMERLPDFRPFEVDPPLTLEVDLKHYRPAELLAYLPAIERVGARTIRFTGRDMPEIARFIEFLNSYRADLQP